MLWAVFQAMQCVQTIKGNASLKVIMNTLKTVYLQPWGIKANPEAIDTGVLCFESCVEASQKRH